MSYDGEIRIKTKVDTSQMQRLQIQIDKATGKVESLVKKYEELKNKKIPTDDYKEVQKQIDATQARLDKLLLKKESFKGSHKSASWLNMNAEIEELQKSLPYMKGELQDLVDTGKAFTLGKDSEEFRQVGADLSRANAELRALITKQNELNGKSGKLSDTLKKTASASKKLFGSMSRDVKKTGGLFSSFGSRLKGIALSLLVFNWVTKGFNAMVSGMKEGYQNLVRYSDKYNKSASALMSANTQMKNSFSTAFAPLIELVMPYLIKFVGFLTEASNRVAQFTAALTGAKTWTKAIAVQQDYASSLDGTAAAAKKAVKVLAGFDELNVLNKHDTTAAGTVNPKDMFTEVEISNEAVKSAAALMEWFSKLQQAIKPFTDALKELWDGGLSKLGNFAWTGLKDFYNEFLVPLGTWAFGTPNEGFTRLVNIINNDLMRIPWDTVNTNLKAFWIAIEPYAEQFGEGLIDFFEDVADLTTDIFIFFFGENGAVTWLTDWLNDNDPEAARKWGYALGVLVTGLMAFGTLKDIIGIFGGLKPFLAVLGTITAGIVIHNADPGIKLGRKINDFQSDNPFPKQEDYETLEEYNAAWDEYTKKYEDFAASRPIIDLPGFQLSSDDFISKMDEFFQKIGDAWMNNYNTSMGWLNNVGTWFGELIGKFAGGWDTFNTWWYENAPLKCVRVWFEEDVIPYFAEEKWREQWENIKKAATNMWKSFKEWWSETALAKWFQENKDTWFSLGWWGDMLVDIPKAFEIAFDAAVKWAVEALKRLISWIGEHLTIGKIFGGLSDVLSGYTDNYNAGFGGGGNRRNYELYGVSVDDIPHYANGAVFRGGNPYAAIVNDQPRGQTNIEAPEDVITQCVRKAVSEEGSGREYIFVAQLNEREIFREIVEQDKMHRKSTGHSAFLY